jgi:hypothetical protein
MKKAARKAAVARLNIYLPDPEIRRQVKAAAARLDLSVSEYCVRAITSQLVQGEETSPGGKRSSLMETSLMRARRFQAETFRGRIFAVSSAELIRESRKDRAAR